MSFSGPWDKVYTHMFMDTELAGMSLTGPVQGLTMGALSGLSQASGILIGKRLGSREYDAAYEDSKKLCGLGVVGSLVFTLLLILVRNPYVQRNHPKRRKNKVCHDD